ncbi:MULTISPECIES: membrane protein [unclassified Streptomyces]|uniref:membrane protein n=1 Tax=unclassified Streptomyces TaxID=2593676 RepID=UPI000308C30F|nr:membrane protein [Streptomyces sp. Tu6071]
MPGNALLRSRRVWGLTGVLGLLQTIALAAARGATAAPTPEPSDNPCDELRAAARSYCERGDSGGPSTKVPDALDPLASLANGCADAASWTVDKLSEAVKSTANVDFTNPKFLQQYAVVFAASTILTLLLWLLAVAKRAVRGVPLTTAITEAVGFLWLTVLASAFTPLILYTVVSATDGITAVLSRTTGSQTDVFFGSFSKALDQGDDIGGGPIMLVVVSLVSILAAGVLWLELVIRAALLYVGALLGTVVYAGLVDKNMWGHVRRWAGVMIAVILVKPVIVIVLGLAGALAGDEGPSAFSAVVSGLAIILLAIFASAMIYRFVPGFGDELVASRSNRMQQGAESRAAAVLSSPASFVAQGIKTHSTRNDGGGNSGGGQNQGGSKAPHSVGEGIAAHGTRGGAQQAAAPAPRSATQTPHASNRGTGTNSTGGEGR